MGRLAEIAGATKLTGKVCFTDAGGITHRCEDEAAAEAVIGSKAVFHHRGAFFEEGCTVRGYTPPEAKPAPTDAKPRSASRRPRRKPPTDE